MAPSGAGIKPGIGGAGGVECLFIGGGIGILDMDMGMGGGGGGGIHGGGFGGSGAFTSGFSMAKI